MEADIEGPFSKGFNQLFPFLLSFLDDALLLGLSRLGLHWRWLHWLSPVMQIGTLLYFAIQLVHWQRGFRHWLKGAANNLKERSPNCPSCDATNNVGGKVRPRKCVS